MTVVFLFPGQSSRYPAFIDKLVDFDPAAGLMIEQASDALGRDLRLHYAADNPAIFSSNQHIQVGVFLANAIYGLLLRQAGVTGDASLGQSLGEYNHLLEIGALTFEDALRLVDDRGRYYDQGPPGMMAAVGPIDAEQLQTILATLPGDGRVAVSNQNSPTQQVIGGTQAAVKAALAVLEDQHFLQGTVVEPQIAMHTELFAEVGARFRRRLEQAPWRTPRAAYLPNVTAEPVQAAPADLIVDLLTRHVSQPSLWRQSLERVARDHADAVFVEVGARSILYNLIKPRWLPQKKLRVDPDIDAPPAIHAVVAALAEAGHVA